MNNTNINEISPEFTIATSQEFWVQRTYEIPPTYAIWICDFTVEQQDSYRDTWAIRNSKGLTLTSKASMWPCLHELLRAA